MYNNNEIQNMEERRYHRYHDFHWHFLPEIQKDYWIWERMALQDGDQSDIATASAMRRFLADFGVDPA